ncbi:hypothetical protein PanWU01x14_212720 [Parasponia andersonii]|uniref:Uncharacterized protein n=1 Tax=Parasponia andersonii TaxID=3476 RepID=A0A2P5BSS6_PARAD|nr:hypothetical protein PanWU01x14_212720 [Parasponia andersonii]
MKDPSSQDLTGKTTASIVATNGHKGLAVGVMTYPSSQDLTGKTDASIAATSGHKGLAGYLSEVALTSRLSSLTLEESELLKVPLRLK